MGRDGNGTLGLETKVTVSLLCTVFGAAYWLVMLGARVDATERSLNDVKSDKADTQKDIADRLRDIAQQQMSMSVDIAGIQARVALLIEWNDIKRKGRSK